MTTRCVWILLALGACATPRVTPREVFHEGRQLEAQGRIDDALARYADAAMLDPDLLDARVARAELLAGVNRVGEALSEYDIVLSKDPALLRALGGRALVRGIAGRFAAAIDDATALVTLEPAMADAYLLRGWLYSQSGKGPEAYRDYHEARRLGHDTWTRYFNAGVKSLERRRYEEAERGLHLASVLAPEELDPLLALGRAHLEMGKFEEAIEDFSKVIDLRREAAHYFHRANARVALRLHEEALRDYEIAIGLQAGQAAYHYGRALALIGLEDGGAALVALTRCLHLEPRNLDARLQRGRLHLAARRFDEAEEDLKKALEISAAPQTIRLLVRIYRQKEDWERAVYYLESALKVCTEEDMRHTLQFELEECRKMKHP